MKITLREDLDPDVDFYYQNQFKIYRKPYLIWSQDTWKDILRTCDVYRIEVDGHYAGDVVLEGRRRGTRYIVDFSILPEHQGKGVGRAVLELLKRKHRRLTAVTRQETLGFFLKVGFVLNKTLRDYYEPGVDGYYISLEGF